MLLPRVDVPGPCAYAELDAAGAAAAPFATYLQSFIPSHYPRCVGLSRLVGSQAHMGMPLNPLCTSQDCSYKNSTLDEQRSQSFACRGCASSMCTEIKRSPWPRHLLV